MVVVEQINASIDYDLYSNNLHNCIIIYVILALAYFNIFIPRVLCIFLYLLLSENLFAYHIFLRLQDEVNYLKCKTINVINAIISRR